MVLRRQDGSPRSTTPLFHQVGGRRRSLRASRSLLRYLARYEEAELVQTVHGQVYNLLVKCHIYANIESDLTGYRGPQP